ncbi:MAG: FG-GAP repeat protein [Candidatus Aenigmarchaeota archaeon]|nr:FG-GAP repeat protein [Candidatus Aenigmarchaeota archaeon]
MWKKLQDRRLIFFAILVALFATAALAYPVVIKVVGGVSGFTTSVLECNDASCSSFLPGSRIDVNSGTSINEYTIIGSGTQYFAEFDYAACRRPYSALITATDATGQGPWTHEVALEKKTNCASEILSANIPDTAVVGRPVSITINAASALSIPPGTPQTIPADLQDEYSAETTVTLRAKDSGGNVIFSQQQTKDMLTSSNSTFTFTLTPTQAGTFTIEITTDVTDCACDAATRQSRSISRTITVEAAGAGPAIDFIPPTPADGSVIGGTQTISAQATGTGIERIAITADGTTLRTCLSGGASSLTCTASGNTAQFSDGPVTVTATARDTTGRTATVSRNFIIDNTAPSVQFIIPTPADGTVLFVPDTFTASASASDANLALITIFVNGVAGTTCSASPCSTGAFSAPGVYQVQAEAADAAGNTARTELRAIEIRASANTRPNVTILLPANGSTFTQGQAVSFIGDAVDAEDGPLPDSALTWSSSIDGTFGTGRIISISSLSAGTHAITLTATDSGGLSSFASITIVIAPVGALTASLAAVPTAGTEPLAVNFICSASGGMPPYSFVINFGDGAQTSLSVVSHVYTQNGNYNAVCTVTDSLGANAADTAAIVVSDASPVANFDFSPALPGVGQAVSFTDLSTSYDPIISWSWSFGDGATSTSQNPAHTYASAGTFEITLTVTDSDGSTAQARRNITVVAVPANNTAVSVSKVLLTGSPAGISDQVVFQITVTNTGTNALPNVNITDVFDSARLSFASASVPLTQTAANTLASGNLGSLASGSAVSVLITFNAMSTGTAGNFVVANARDAAGNAVSDTDNAGVDIITGVPGVPGIVVEKRLLTGSPAQISGTIIFEIRVTNTGQTTFTSVPLFDFYDSALLQFAGATTMPDTTFPGIAFWNDVTGAGALDPAESFFVNVSFRAVGSGIAENMAMVNNAIDDEGNSLSADSSADVTVNPLGIGIDVEKTLLSSQPAGPGSTVMFQVNITNTGNTTLISIPLTDLFDSSLLGFSGSTISPDSAGSCVLSWNNLAGAGLAPGSRISFSVLYTAICTNVANVSAWTNEINVADAAFGSSVASGDFNGDGYNDVIAGARNYANGQSGEGAAFAYYGSAAGLPQTPSWQVESNSAGAQFGSAVASAGDVNNDGYDDAVIGAPGYSNGQNSEGAAFLFLGSAAGLLPGSSWSAESNQDFAFFGTSVAGAGDVNGDGFGDVIAGAPRYDNGESDEGAVFAYLGSSAGLSPAAAWTAEGNQIEAEFGTSVSSAGDANLDGYDDVVIGAPQYDSPTFNEGVAFVYYGSASGLALNFSWADDSGKDSAYFGYSVASGDVNGDNYSDLVIGALYYGIFSDPFPAEGRVFVYHGTSTGFRNIPSRVVAGNQRDANLGTSVAAVDVDGDGFDDMAAGAPGYDNGETNEGQVFVFLGSASGIGSTANWTQDGNQANALFSSAVASGDVNGDGRDELIIGAPGYDNGETNEGRVYSFSLEQLGGNLVTTVNTARSANAMDTNGNTVQDTDAEQVTIQCALSPQPILQVDKTLLSSPVTGVGSPVVFRIRVSNAGGAAASNVVLTDTFDSRLSFLSATTTPTTVSSGTIVWSPLTASLAPGQTTEINITFTAVAAGIAANTVSVTGSTDIATVTIQSAAPSGNIINSTVNGTFYSQQSIDIFPNIRGDTFIINSTVGSKIGSFNILVSIIDSFINHSSVFDVFSTNSTLQNVTAEQSTLRNSEISFVPGFCSPGADIRTVIFRSLVEKSEITNSEIINSTVRLSSLACTQVRDSPGTVENSTLVSSNVTQDSEINNSVLRFSSANNSMIKQSTARSSQIKKSDIERCTIDNSTVENTTAGDCTIDNSLLINSNIQSCTINNVTAENSSIISCPLDFKNIQLRNANVNAFAIQRSSAINYTISCSNGTAFVTYSFDNSRDLRDLCNFPPTASGSRSPVSGIAQTTPITFSSAGSTDPNAGFALGDSLSYEWTFGDGSTASTLSTTIFHTYNSAGTFTALLKAVDKFGLSDSTALPSTPISAKPATSDGGSPGGGGGVTITPGSGAEITGDVTMRFFGVDPRLNYTFEIDRDIAITKVIFSTTKSFSNLSIAISRLQSTPYPEKPFLYQYNKVDATISNSELDRREVEFRVRSQWLEDNNIERADVRIAVWHEGGGRWIDIEPHLLRVTEDYTYYTTQVPILFTTYAIFGFAEIEPSESFVEEGEDYVSITIPRLEEKEYVFLFDVEKLPVVVLRFTSAGTLENAQISIERVYEPMVETGLADSYFRISSNIPELLLKNIQIRYRVETENLIKETVRLRYLDGDKYNDIEIRSDGQGDRWNYFASNLPRLSALYAISAARTQKIEFTEPIIVAGIAIIAAIILIILIAHMLSRRGAPDEELPSMPFAHVVKKGRKVL